MSRTGKNFPAIILFTLGWIIFTALMLFAGYCITGAIPEIEGISGYVNRLLIVATHPSGDFLNEYSPIGIIAGFILSELIFGFSFCLSNRKRTECEIEKKIVDQVCVTDNKDPEPDALDDSDSVLNESIRPVSANDEDKDDEEVVLQEKVFLDLFSRGYSMQQINEMMELTKYIKEVDAGLLERMFRTNMSPEEIRQHIEIFYG